MSSTFSSLHNSSPVSHNSTVTTQTKSIYLAGRKTLGAFCHPRAIKGGTSTATSTTVSCKYSEAEESEEKKNNLLLRVAWYGSEILGIAASLVKKTRTTEETEEKENQEELVISCERTRDEVVGCIKRDFLRSYFVTGNLTIEAYEEDCEFADPAGSFRGLKRFKRNCTNFGSLLLKSNMKLTKWEDFEGKGIGHWKFSCVMSFPWRPILSATGYTEYYFHPQTNKVCRHVEHWNVPKMALLKQIFKPTRWLWG